jgi:ADP-heptose:LPS heptosyltransferase
MELKQILVIQNKRIGDVLISSVIANNIKKVFPKSHVTYFVYDYTVGVLENNPNIDHIISVEEKVLKKPLELFKMMRYIRAQKYAIIFDPYSKFQSRLICLYSNAGYRIGQKSGCITLGECGYQKKWYVLWPHSMPFYTTCLMQKYTPLCFLTVKSFKEKQTKENFAKQNVSCKSIAINHVFLKLSKTHTQKQWSKLGK